MEEKIREHDFFHLLTPSMDFVIFSSKRIWIEHSLFVPDFVDSYGANFWCYPTIEFFPLIRERKANVPTPETTMIPEEHPGNITNKETMPRTPPDKARSPG